MDKEDMQAQTELGQKLAEGFGTMGRKRTEYTPEGEDMGDGGSEHVTEEVTEPKPGRFAHMTAFGC